MYLTCSSQRGSIVSLRGAAFHCPVILPYCAPHADRMQELPAGATSQWCEAEAVLCICQIRLYDS